MQGLSAQREDDDMAFELDDSTEGVADLKRLARLRSRLPQSAAAVLKAQGAEPLLTGIDDGPQWFLGRHGWSDPYLPPLDSHLVGVALAAAPGCSSWLQGAGQQLRGLLPGQLLLVPAGAPAYLRLPEPESLMWLVLRPREMYQGGARTPPTPLRAAHGVADPVVHGLAAALLAAARLGSPGLPALAGHVGRALVAQLLGHHGEPHAPPRERLSQARLERALAFLDSRLAQPVDLAEAAQVAGCSVPHFAHLFKSAMGVSPMRYLRERRMQSARELIETTRLSISEIGHRVGLPGAARFSQAFRAYWKTSPSALRRPG